MHFSTVTFPLPPDTSILPPSTFCAFSNLTETLHEAASAPSNTLNSSVKSVPFPVTLLKSLEFATYTPFASLQIASLAGNTFPLDIDLSCSTLLSYSAFTFIPYIPGLLDNDTLTVTVPPFSAETDDTLNAAPAACTRVFPPAIVMISTKISPITAMILILSQVFLSCMLYPPKNYILMLFMVPIIQDFLLFFSTLV